MPRERRRGGIERIALEHLGFDRDRGDNLTKDLLFSAHYRHLIQLPRNQCGARRRWTGATFSSLKSPRTEAAFRTPCGLLDSQALFELLDGHSEQGNLVSDFCLYQTHLRLAQTPTSSTEIEKDYRPDTTATVSQTGKLRDLKGNQNMTKLLSITLAHVGLPITSPSPSVRGAVHFSQLEYSMMSMKRLKATTGR